MQKYKEEPESWGVFFPGCFFLSGSRSYFLYWMMRLYGQWEWNTAFFCGPIQTTSFSVLKEGPSLALLKLFLPYVAAEVTPVLVHTSCMPSTSLCSTVYIKHLFCFHFKAGLVISKFNFWWQLIFSGKRTCY